ncbi:MAG: MFS transporter [Candidatus Zixiibacteriota bacterium]|nr:MAG: MFS transporter [candidate division Zixibacteria bacterium]
MATLDGSILNVALPTISRDLGCSVDVVAWVILAYTLTLISLMLVFGAWSGIKGYSFSYRFGYSLFIVGSATCALSGTIYMLIFGRVVQAIGTAMFAAVGPGMVTQVFPPEERGKGIGMMVMMVSAGFMVGPPLGGFMLDIWPWTSIFVINIPIGFAGLYMTYRYFQSVPPSSPGQELKLKGAVSVSLGLVSGTLALSLINDYAITDYRVWGLGLVSLAALSAFVWFESQKASAMIGLDIFKNRQFRTSIGAMLLMFIALSGILILIPFYLEQVRHFQPKQVGLYLIILPILMFILAPLSGRLSDRIGYRLLTSLGVGMLIAGLLLLTNLDVDTSNIQIITYLVVVGAGVGVFNTPNSSALMGSVREDQRAVTSSILATTRNIGMSIGVALSTALFAYFQINYAGGGTAGEIFTMSYKNVIYVSAAIAVGSLMLCLTRGGSPTTADK